MKAWIRISEAARIMGVTRSTAHRRLRAFAVYRRGRSDQAKLLYVPLVEVYRYVQQRVVEEIPPLPEIAEFREELDAMQGTIELLSERMGRLAAEVSRGATIRKKPNVA